MKGHPPLWAKERSRPPRTRKKQIEQELALIAKLGFAGYFLIVWDIVRYCKQQ